MVTLNLYNCVFIYSVLHHTMEKHEQYKIAIKQLKQISYKG